MSHAYKNFLAGVIIGGAIGATAVLFLRTKQGKKIQKDLHEKYEDIKEAALKTAGKVKKRIKKATPKS